MAVLRDSALRVMMMMMMIMMGAINRQVTGCPNGTVSTGLSGGRGRGVSGYVGFNAHVWCKVQYSGRCDGTCSQAELGQRMAWQEQGPGYSEQGQGTWP